MTVDLTRPSRATRQGSWPAAGAVEAPTRARRRGRREPYSMLLRWTHRLLLRRTHPWPHRDDTGPGIVEGGQCRGAPAVVAEAVGAVVLAFPLPFALTLAFAAVVGVGGRRGRGHLRAWRFLRWWAQRQQLLQRTPSS
jgi:hypothetical protein